MAMMLQRPLEQVCRFLYQLTIKRFGEILNPKCSHWNWYRVPFTRPDTCGLYDGIFDMHGNLRNPLHPYIQHILLTILNHYLNIPCQGYKEQHYPSMLDEIRFGRSEGKCTDIFRADKDGVGSKLRQDWDASGLGYKFGGSDFNPDGDGKDGGGKKGKGDDDDEIVVNKRGKAKFGEDDEDDGAGKGKGDRKSMKDISNLYSKVVTNQHKRKLVGSKSADVDDASDDYGYYQKPKKQKVPKPKKKKRYGGTDRQFMGEMLPVLVHEPFDESKPWTWIRRHPKQTRVLQGTKLGRAKVHRYKGESLEIQFQRAKQKYSVRSIFSIGSDESIGWEDTFGKRSYMMKKKSMAKPYDYKKLLEKPDDGMARISVVPIAPKVPLKTKGKPKSN